MSNIVTSFLRNAKMPNRKVQQSSRSLQLNHPFRYEVGIELGNWHRLLIEQQLKVLQDRKFVSLCFPILIDSIVVMK